MSATARQFILGLLALLAAGAIIGGLYGHVYRGLLVASLVALIWQVRNLLAFNHALHSQDFDAFRIGEGIWQQIFSRFAFERERAARRKGEYRRLLKEIRRSTDALPDGAVILDENNDIVVCNRAAKELAGLKRKKDRGTRIDNLLRDPKLSRMLAADDYLRSIEIRSPVVDGKWLNCRVAPYGAGQKLLILRDITERKRLTKMRRDFVANASHELRSPLTVISGYLDSLADDRDVPPHWEQPMKQMRAQARRMNRIVEELLELSRLESSGAAGTDAVVDVAELLAAAKAEAFREGRTAPIEVILESTSQLRGNAAEIESAIINLMTNAVRHTPVDGRITVRWRPDADGAELIIEDTGEGIDPKYLPRLTERFFRVDKGRARTDGGVGLGLAIVKHVLSRHDAELTIESTLGEGSSFRCRFPSSRVVVHPPIPLVGERSNA